MIDVTRVLKWIAGLALGAALAAALASPDRVFAQETWKGMDSLETMDSRFERRNTLKVVRSNGDVDDTLNDQGSVLGYGTAAATGNVEPRVGPGTTESLEIMKKGEIEAADKK